MRPRIPDFFGRVGAAYRCRVPPAGFGASQAVALGAWLVEYREAVHGPDGPIQTVNLATVFGPTGGVVQVCVVRPGWELDVTKDPEVVHRLFIRKYPAEDSSRILRAAWSAAVALADGSLSPFPGMPALGEPGGDALPGGDLVERFGEDQSEQFPVTTKGGQ